MAPLAAFAGAVHLGLAGEHFHETAWLGWLFVADGVGLLAAALWLDATGSTPAWRAAAWASGATVVAYVASRTIGLPGQAVEAWDRMGIGTTAAELVVAVAGVVVVSARMRARSDRAAWSVVAGAIVLAIGGIVWVLQGPAAVHGAHPHDGGGTRAGHTHSEMPAGQAGHGE